MPDSFVSAKITETKPDWYHSIKRYERSHLWKAIWQLLNTFIPYFLVCILMYFGLIADYSDWVILALAVVAAGLAARVAEDFPTGDLRVLAPLVRRRKGFHLDAIEAAARKGVSEVRIDGRSYDAAKPPRVDRFQIHDVEAVVAGAKYDTKIGPLKEIYKKVDRLILGGVIYNDAADKGARFIELMNQKGIPIIFLQDVTGFMVGKMLQRERKYR